MARQKGSLPARFSRMAKQHKPPKPKCGAECKQLKKDIVHLLKLCKSDLDCLNAVKSAVTSIVSTA